jgi:REP element-mobilizing transposase RayT
MTIRRKYSSLRLKGYDYSQSGAYFVTLCTKNQVRYFENNESKNLVTEAWTSLPERFPTITLDEFTVMPNHLHFSIWLDPEVVGASIHCAQMLNDPKHRQRELQSPLGKRSSIDQYRPTLGQITRSLKARVTREIRRSGIKEFSWQRRYYDHVIRSEEALTRIREYISTNPQRWHLDRYNPDSDGVDQEAIELWECLKSDDSKLYALG